MGLGHVVQLQTADGQVLTAERDLLSSASDVLASKLDELDGPPVLSLPHSAAQLRIVLDILAHPLPSPPPPSALWRAATVIPILQNLELDQLLLGLKSALRKAASDEASPKIFVFLAAARLPSMDICAMCVRNGGMQIWREVLLGMDDDVEEEIDIERDMRELSTFDVKGWSEAVSTKVPGEVMSRLWKAQMGIGLEDMEPEGLEDAWAQVATRFKGA